jgi:hypothetical protein
MPGPRRHSKKFDRCVRDVKKSGSAKNPYAVCSKSVGRKRNPRPRSTSKMPPALRRYWRKKNAEARGRRRARNPKGFVITARKSGAALYYDGVGAFNGLRSRAHTYQARGDAEVHSKTLREVYANQLAGWNVRVEQA